MDTLLAAVIPVTTLIIGSLGFMVWKGPRRARSRLTHGADSSHVPHPSAEHDDQRIGTASALVSTWQWRRVWWIATVIHTIWVLGLISWTITWSDVQLCGGEGFMGFGVYPCWESAYRLGLWSFAIPMIGLGSVAVIPPYIRHLSPYALRDGAPIWRRLTVGSALVIGALIAIALYQLWLVYRLMTTDIP